MKRYITTLIALCAVLFSASAQVAKQVEVTKDYAPEIGEARKMDIAPNMVDTITLRPEIDYTITPRSFASALGTHRFKPATVTYWEYQRKYPFYLKMGVGYPLNTVGDFYATTHRADVGYLTGYAQHYGQYSTVNGTEYKGNKSMQMNNKFGVTGGKYIGRYTLAGDLFYRMDTYYRYPLNNAEFTQRKIDFEDVNLALSFGDSFTDYSHLNFKVYASADLYNDKSKNFIVGDHYQQLNVAGGVALAREITKRSALSINLDYKGYYGQKSLSNYRNSVAGGTLMYRYRSGGLLDMNVGVEVLYDHNPAYGEKKSRWHAFPHLALSLNINDKTLGGDRAVCHSECSENLSGLGIVGNVLCYNVGCALESGGGIGYLLALLGRDELLCIDLDRRIVAVSLLHNVLRERLESLSSSNGATGRSLGLEGSVNILKLYESLCIVKREGDLGSELALTVNEVRNLLAALVHLTKVVKSVVKVTECRIVKSARNFLTVS